MKAVSLISAVVLVVGVFPITASAATIFTDGFESGFASWDGGTTPASGKWETNATGHAGASVSVKGSTNTPLVKSISTSGQTTISISYWYKTEGLEAADKVEVQWFNGSTWSTAVGTLSGSVASWTQNTHVLPAGAANNVNFKIRFVPTLDQGNDKIHLDDVIIAGTTIVIDTDNDGIADSSDNCPAVSNANQANNDGDSQGDACDTDDDNDTVLDTTDNCDFLANLNQLDSDGDNVGNACDETPYTPEQLCEQQEGMSWVEGGCHEDVVTPTEEELCEAQEGMSWNGEECVEDYVPPTPEEVCEANGGSWTGVICLPDACPEVPGFQVPLTDCDGQTDEELCEVQEGMSWVNNECVSDQPAPVDTDEDGVPDSTDNCDSTANADQLDSDEDGIGDACDTNEGTEGENEETPEAPAPTSSSHGLKAECNNNEDDDNDGIYDINDTDCENTSDDSEGSSGSVLGAATCAATITEYMGSGKNNTPGQVKFLQEFLNKELGLDLEVNGVYDRPTLDAVKTFQAKYLDEVLTPWGISEATGYAYKTTLRMIAMIMCPGSDMPMPELY